MLKKVIIGVLVVVSGGIMAFEHISEEGSNDKTKEDSAEDIYEPIVVLELFTSQGCSSCPAADQLLNTIKKEGSSNIFALSYHVDYWNYIGWEDPFSKPQYAEKQRAYNQKFKNRSNYTPQVVINGKEHFVGSHAAKMRTKIATYKNQKTANKIELANIKSAGSTIDFDYKIEGAIAGKRLKAVLVIEERTTQVKRGENRDRTLKNSNIVVAEHLEVLGATEGKIRMVLPSLVVPKENVQLMVFTENEIYDITGAAKSPVPR